MSEGHPDSSVANTDIDDSNSTDRRPLLDTSKLHFSVYSLKYNPLRVATICLGVTGVLLLAALIGQSVSYRKQQQENTNKLQAVNADKDGLQKLLSSVQKENSNIEERQNQLRQNIETLFSKRRQMQTQYTSLAQEMNKVSLSESSLRSSNAALTESLEQLNEMVTELQNNKDQLAMDSDLIQVEFHQAVQHTTTLEENCRTMTAERNILQNSFNNISRIKQQLQSSYNSLTMQVESLEKRLHVNGIEKDQAEVSHMNATTAKKTLQEIHDVLFKSTEQLNSTYNDLLREKQELEKRSGLVQAEKDLLVEKNRNLTAERDQLQVEVKKRQLTKERDRLIELLKTLGWVYFGGSLYLGSNEKRSWHQSRQFCQSKGADLLIINNQQEQQFIRLTFHERHWIGLHDIHLEGDWTWVDGSPLTFSKWHSRQPDSYGGNEDCAGINFFTDELTNWDDDSCSYKYKCICEKKILLS